MKAHFNMRNLAYERILKTHGIDSLIDFCLDLLLELFMMPDYYKLKQYDTCIYYLMVCSERMDG